MQQPAITVLMTVFNGIPYIRETVKSILGQTRRDFTFLILNNGSEDGTGEYLAQLEAEHGVQEGGPVLKIVHLERNIGRTPVLNMGLGLVETELTAIIDADDIAMPERLARITEFFVRHPDIDLVGSDVTYIDSTGNITGEDRFPSGHDELCQRMPLYNQFAHAACAYRTEKARAVGGYSTDFPYAQDMALWIAMLKAGCKVGSIPEILACIRTHPGQATCDIALIKVRSNDNYKLAQAMLDVSCLNKAARQTARLRSAGALIKLERYSEALKEAFRGVLEAPLLLPVNRLLWSRVLLEWKRKCHNRRR